MVLKIGEPGKESVWHLHFHREFSETDEERAAKKLPPLLWSMVTVCAIHTGPCIPALHQSKSYCITGTVGTAKCSKKDQNVKGVGAKLALAQAMKGLAINVRRQIWDAYWLRVRRPKEKPEKFRERVGALTNPLAA